MVDFVESGPCRVGPVNTGDKVERTLDMIQATESTVMPTQSIELATMSTETSCRIRVTADLSLKRDKVDCIGNKVDRVTGFGNSRLCHQCVPGLNCSSFSFLKFKIRGRDCCP